MVSDCSLRAGLQETWEEPAIATCHSSAIYMFPFRVVSRNQCRSGADVRFEPHFLAKQVDRGGAMACFEVVCRKPG